MGADNNKEAAPSTKTAYFIVGAVAAAVSAATVAYVFYRRQKMLAPHVQSVQDLLDRCHDQVHSIEQRLSELSSSMA